jgi:transposase InsO family protein
LSNLLNASFCIEALEDAVSQGQLTGDDFTGVLRARGVAIGTDSRGRLAHNIFVERRWRSLKYEDVNLKAYENVAEGRQGITANFEFYNHQRLHHALAYQLNAPGLRRSSATCQFGTGAKRWRAPNTISTMRCKPGQDFLPYDRPITVSKIGSTSADSL